MSSQKRIAAALAAVIVVVSLAVTATPEAGAQGRQKRYKATRAFVADKQTGAVRMPTQAEVDEVVANLAAMGQRPDDTLAQSTQSNGTVTVDLDGGFGGVVLARPSEDGTWETRCVFTLEEGAAFLGLVEDVQ